MASTNKTPNYELSQFVANDKPAWLSDYNGDMLKIDTGIAEAKGVADAAASTASGAIATANNAVDAAHAASVKVDALGSVIDTVEAKADNATTEATQAMDAATSAGNVAGSANTKAETALTTGSSALERANSAYALANSKQNVLTFDSAPRAGSQNPVTSGGIWDAINNISPSANVDASLGGGYIGGQPPYTHSKYNYSYVKLGGHYFVTLHINHFDGDGVGIEFALPNANSVAYSDWNLVWERGAGYEAIAAGEINIVNGTCVITLPTSTGFLTGDIVFSTN